MDMIEQNEKEIDIYLSCIWMFERKEMKKKKKTFSWSGMKGN